MLQHCVFVFILALIFPSFALGQKARQHEELKNDNIDHSIQQEVIDLIKVSPSNPSSSSIEVEFSALGLPFSLAFEEDKSLLARESGAIHSPSLSFHTYFAPKSDRVYRAYRGVNGSAALFVGNALYKLSFTHPRMGGQCVIEHPLSFSEEIRSSLVDQDSFLVSFPSSESNEKHSCGNKKRSPGHTHEHNSMTNINGHSTTKEETFDPYKLDELHPSGADQHASKRQGSSTTTEGILTPPVGPCPQKTKSITLSLASDYSFSTRVQDPHAELVWLSAQASALLSMTMNIQVIVGELVVQTAKSGEPAWNKCSKPQTQLDQFTLWTTQQPTTGLWHLLTYCYRSGVVALSWNDGACVTQDISQSDGSLFGNTALTSYVKSSGYLYFLHGILHGFGSAHDTEGLMVGSNIQSLFVTRTVQENVCAFSATLPCLTSTTPRHALSSSSSSSSLFSSTSSTSSMALPTHGRRDSNDAIVSAVNSERARYAMPAIEYDISAESFAQSIARSCNWSHIFTPTWTNSYYRAAEIPSNGGGSAQSLAAIQSVLTSGRASYSCFLDSCPGDDVLSCQFYRRLIYQQATGIGCDTEVCTDPDGVSWDYTVCSVTPYGPSYNERTCPSNFCPYTWTPSCEELNLQCGYLFNSLLELTCGNGECGAPYYCSSGGQCVCDDTTTCESAGVTCGVVINNCGDKIYCGTANETHPTCSSCVPVFDSPESACEAMGQSCGSVYDGCEMVLCGGCYENNQCVNGQCITYATSCSSWAELIDGECVCLPGYAGDGRVCMAYAEPDGCDYIEYAYLLGADQNGFVANDQANSLDCGLFHMPSEGEEVEAIVYTAYTHVGDVGDIKYSVTITRDYGNPGIVFGASDPSAEDQYYMLFYWSDANSSFVLEANYLSFSDSVFMSNASEFDEWASGEAKEIVVNWFSNGYFYISVNGVNWDMMEVVGWPSQLQMGIVCDANCSASFTSPSYVTLNRVEFGVFGCFSESELTDKVANMLRIPADQVLDAIGCTSASDTSSVTYSHTAVTLVGGGDRCSLALSQQLVEFFEKGTFMRGGPFVINTTLPSNFTLVNEDDVITVYIPVPPEWTGGEIAALSVSLVFATLTIISIAMMAYSFHVYDEIDKDTVED